MVKNVDEQWRFIYGIDVHNQKAILYGSWHYIYGKEKKTFPNYITCSTLSIDIDDLSSNTTNYEEIVFALFSSLKQ